MAAAHVEMPANGGAGGAPGGAAGGAGALNLGGPYPPVEPSIIFLHRFIAFFNVRVSEHETKWLSRLLRWCSLRSEAPTFQEALYKVAAGVKPGQYFSHEEDMVDAGRVAMTNFIKGMRMLRSPLAVDMSHDGPAPTNLFTGEPCPAADTYWAIVQPEPGKPVPEKLYSTAEAWAYHVMLNDAKCPVSRLNIIGFGFVPGDTSVNSSAMPAAGTPADPLPLVVAGSEEKHLYYARAMMRMSEAEADQLILDMSAPIVRNNRAYMGLEWFEALYNVPDEERLSALQEDLYDDDDEVMADDDDNVDDHILNMVQQESLAAAANDIDMP